MSEEYDFQPNGEAVRNILQKIKDFQSKGNNAYTDLLDVDLSEIDFETFTNKDWEKLAKEINKLFNSDPHSGEFFELKISNNQSIKSIPEQINLINSSFELILEDLENLTDLPSSILKVCGLKLVNLPRLYKLPEKLDEELDTFCLINLPLIREIPEGVTFNEEAKIKLKKLNNLRKIPLDFLNIELIYYEEIDINSKALDSLTTYEYCDFLCYKYENEDFDELLGKLCFDFTLAKRIYKEKNLIYSTIEEKLKPKSEEKTPSVNTENFANPLNNSMGQEDFYKFWKDHKSAVFREVFNQLYDYQEFETYIKKELQTAIRGFIEGQIKKIIIQLDEDYRVKHNKRRNSESENQHPKDTQEKKRDRNRDLSRSAK